MFQDYTVATNQFSFARQQEQRKKWGEEAEQKTRGEESLRSRPGELENVMAGIVIKCKIKHFLREVGGFEC